jgi:hypothetical protein
VSKTLDAIRQLSWVAEVDDEREAGSSIIVTLREGYEFACNAGCGVQGFDTVGAARAGTARSAVLELAVHTAVDHVETKRVPGVSGEESLLEELERIGEVRDGYAVLRKDREGYHMRHSRNLFNCSVPT